EHRGGPGALRDHGCGARGERRVARSSGRPRARQPRRARHQARHRRDPAGRRRAGAHPDPALRNSRGAARSHAAQDGRHPRPRLGARAGGDDLPPRGRGALARPLRVAPRPQATQHPSVEGRTARRPPPGEEPAQRAYRYPHHAPRGDPMTATPLLKLDGVSMQYGSGPAAVTALTGVDLTVNRGELVAVMGASGSGKSSLLTVAGGLVRPTAGEVIVDGQWLSSLKAGQLAALRRRHLGFVFQDYNLVPALTAIENVSLPLELDGWKTSKARRAARDALS